MPFLKKNKGDDVNLGLDVPNFNPGESKEKAPEVSSVPSYQHEFGTIKKEVNKPIIAQPRQQPQVNIPERKPIENVNRVSGDKPVFVKIDNYQDAMDNIDKVKDMIGDAEDLLENIHKLRADEDRELENWHRSLDKLKDRLLNVDRKLFEL
ncbi:hypothetical protein HN747_02205 [archaeon]|jgi:hypothetical protein|nr:hypothetical protein [archaeon]